LHAGLVAAAEELRARREQSPRRLNSEIGPKMLARVAKKAGLRPEDL